MKATVWIISVVLVLAFLFIGGMKLLTPAAELAQSAQGVPVGLLKVAGAVEVLGAVGLVLPAATRIMPALTPLAAGGLVVVMAGAVVTNLLIGAYSAIVMPLVLGLLAGFVAWARFSGRVRPEGRRRGYAPGTTATATN